MVGDGNSINGELLAPIAAADSEKVIEVSTQKARGVAVNGRSVDIPRGNGG